MITYIAILTLTFIVFECLSYVFLKGWMTLNKIPVGNYISKRIQSNVKLTTWELHVIKELLPNKLKPTLKKSLTKEQIEYSDISHSAGAFYIFSLIFTVITLCASVDAGSQHFGPIVGTLIALSVLRIFLLTIGNCFSGISAIFESLVKNRKKSFTQGRDALKAEFGKELCQDIDEDVELSWGSYIKSHLKLKKKSEEQLNTKLKEV